MYNCIHRKWLPRVIRNYFTPAFYSPSQLSHLVNRTKLEEQGWNPARRRRAGQRKRGSRFARLFAIIVMNTRRESSRWIAAGSNGMKGENEQPATLKSWAVRYHWCDPLLVSDTRQTGNNSSSHSLLYCFLPPLLFPSLLTSSYFYFQTRSWLCAPIDQPGEQKPRLKAFDKSRDRA